MSEKKAGSHHLGIQLKGGPPPKYPSSSDDHHATTIHQCQRPFDSKTLLFNLSNRDLAVHRDDKNWKTDRTERQGIMVNMRSVLSAWERVLTAMTCSVISSGKQRQYFSIKYTRI